MQLRTITSKTLGAEFYVHKATKHHSVCNGSTGLPTVAQPGNYVAMDRFFNMYVFTRQQFKTYFGHAAVELLDELEEI